MVFTDKTEKGFETLIVNWLVEQNGYEQGANDDYSKEYAVDEPRLFQFLKDNGKSLEASRYLLQGVIAFLIHDCLLSRYNRL